jgi:hypothetical protein
MRPVTTLRRAAVAPGRRGGMQVARIYAAILADSGSGALAPGGKLNEQAVAGRFGSRGSLREAIRPLGRAGRSAACRPSEAHVTVHSPEESIETFAICESREGIAARLAAINTMVDERIELRKVFEAEKGRGRPPSHDRDFPMHIVQQAQRPPSPRHQPGLLPASEALVLASDLALARDRPFLVRAASHSRGNRAKGSRMRRNSHAPSYCPAERGEHRQSPVPETTAR